MRRFLQHVLPCGFMKVPYYGFLSPSCSVPLEEVEARIEMAQGFALPAAQVHIEAPPAMRCRHLRGMLKYLRSILPPALARCGPLAPLRHRALQAATTGSPASGP